MPHLRVFSSWQRRALLVGLLFCGPVAQAFLPSALTPRCHSCSSRTELSALSGRERDIRRTIRELKKEGKLKKKNDPDDGKDKDRDDDAYANKIAQKLGKAKSKILGFDGVDSDTTEEEEEELPQTPRAEEPEEPYIPPEDTGTDAGRKPLIDPSLFDSDENDEDDLTEEELVDLVAERMTKRRDEERREEEEARKKTAQERLARLEEERQTAEATAAATDNSNDSTELKKTTTGIGGSWKKNTTAEEDVYQPKSGSWGAFPRPRDISKTYGGGRRVGPGYSNEAAAAQSSEATRARLREYREKAGIIVQSEIDNAEEIDNALKIAGYAMQRGVYNSAVSALEKVTKYCSSNSKLGGKVYLELAMAYEASGRAEEALIVYKTLTNCRIEEIKYNAKRLLYGLEAMQFMQKEVGSKEFSRKKAKNTFIDTTGLANIASNFDDVYNTAWIDTEGSFYKSLTKNVVRSTREARQILLRATGAGEVERTRIVQALRSISRRFDDALEEEIRNRPAEDEDEEETATVFIDGIPIKGKKRNSRDEMPAASLMDLDEFVLVGGEQMRENIDGEWRLQLLADKQGNGVKFFNTTLSWQKIDLGSSRFSAEGRATGFLNVEQSGKVLFDEDRRILSRKKVQVSGSGGMLAGIFGSTDNGAPGAVGRPQQVMSVDSVIMLTRRDVQGKRKKDGDEKEFFAVWRRMDSESGGGLEDMDAATLEMNL